METETEGGVEKGGGSEKDRWRQRQKGVGEGGGGSEKKRWKQRQKGGGVERKRGED